MTAVGDLFEIDLSELDLDHTEPRRSPSRSGAPVAEGGETLTNVVDKDDRAAAWVTSERTAWQYVTAMHAAAVGGPRTPIRGIVEDVEDMREHLTRERDEARARVEELERRLERRKSG
jgi:hypothetical protein